MKLLTYIFAFVSLAFLTSCGKTDIHISKTLQQPSPLIAEYEGIVLPPNIASLNFYLPDAADGKAAIIINGDGCKVTAMVKDGAAIPDLKDWHHLLELSKGKDLQVQHCTLASDGWCAYPAFTMHVANESIDPYLAYRLIPPGYEKWNLMGLYQRCLENFDEKEIIENNQTERNCYNCHSFCMQDPSRMQFHVRAQHGCTILYRDGKIQKLNTKTDDTMSNLVYPYWHPSGKYIAYSVNDTHQFFHTHNNNRIEVLDYKSDVVVYDISHNRLLTTGKIFSNDALETFPTFSPDGKTLYFCSARQVNIPDEYDKLRYDLCSISFDEATGTFGTEVDTVFHASEIEKSVTFPRISPDGKYLLFTLASYGTFSIWHQDADLWMLNLATKEVKSMDDANSSSVDSYHTWSSNSRWVVFSSRRGNELYTRPYIAYARPDGTLCKPFLLPQKRGDYYLRQINSFNVPELIKGPVPVSRHQLTKAILSEECLQVQGFKK